jgi:hypothetical protein
MDTSSTQFQFPSLIILLVVSLYGLLLVPVIALKYSYSSLFTAGAGVGFVLMAGSAGFLWLYQRRMIPVRAGIYFQTTLTRVMRWLTHDPLNIAEWAGRGPQAGAPDMAAYFAFETFASAFLHLIVLGVGMGLVLGIIGALAGKVAKMIVHSMH